MKLRVFENRVLSRIFEPSRIEVLGRWRKLHNEELRELYSSPSIIRMISYEKRPLRRPRCRWMDNIKMDLGDVGWGGMDCIGLAQDRDKWRALVNAVMSLRVPLNAEKVSTCLTAGGLSSSAQLYRVSYLLKSCSQVELKQSHGDE
jgi:hypothetical protein